MSCLIAYSWVNFPCLETYEVGPSSSETGLFLLFIISLTDFTSFLSKRRLCFFPSVTHWLCMSRLGPEALPRETEFSIVPLAREEKISEWDMSVAKYRVLNLERWSHDAPACCSEAPWLSHQTTPQTFMDTECPSSESSNELKISVSRDLVWV